MISFHEVVTVKFVGNLIGHVLDVNAVSSSVLRQRLELDLFIWVFPLMSFYISKK